MSSFIHFKPFDYIKFAKHIESAVITNQFSNYGASVHLLEQRARDMLKIDDSKAVIATNNGASALHSMLLAISRKDGYRPIFTQDFTFPCNMQGPAEYAVIVDLNDDYQIDLYNIRFDFTNSIIIVTNCFGHLQDLNRIISFANDYNSIVLFDFKFSPLN